MTFASFIEPLRQVNRLLGRTVYSWRLLSVDGNPVTASAGTQVVVDGDLSLTHPIDYAFVCSGIQIQDYDDAPVSAWLRKMASHGKRFGAISTATLLLARAGVLADYKSTIHWEALSSFREQYPQLQVSSALFEIDRNLITCAGATACIDLMLHLIGQRLGHAVAAAVSEQYNVSQIRRAVDDQHLPRNVRLRTNHPRLLAALGLMEANIESPLDLISISEKVGLSSRQLERLFQHHLGTSVIRHYRFLRLRRANLLLTQTSLTVVEVAMACGYRCQSHFGKDYRRMFGYTPAKERLRGRDSRHAAVL